jgi:DNA-binding NarL/FixJ family response regulator
MVAAESDVRTVVVDDHTLFRHGLKRLLEENGFNIVGEASNGKSAVDLIGEKAPDVVLMDLEMPLMDGIEATSKVIENNPDARIIVLTISTDKTRVVDALVAGASGYVLKDAEGQEIVAAARSVIRGDSVISPGVASQLVNAVRTVENDRVLPLSEETDNGLTEREAEILRLIATGKDNCAIAQQLFISPKTVKNHVASILVKLAVENRIQAAVYAVRNGMV